MPEETPVVEATDDEPKGLRARLEAALDENKALKATQLETSIKAIGLNPDSGLGKAVAKTFSGDITSDAVAEFAKSEYEWEVPEVQPVQSPVAQAITDSHAVLDGVNEAAGSITPPSTQDQIAAAEAAGNFDAAIAMKGAQLGAMLRPNQ